MNNLEIILTAISKLKWYELMGMILSIYGYIWLCGSFIGMFLNAFLKCSGLSKIWEKK
jgi:hypothetical protein